MAVESIQERLILALDVNTQAEAVRLVTQLHAHVGVFKVGLELVNAAGMGIFAALKDVGAERLFYDAKLHDIPNTVAGAARAATRHGLWMLNVHAAGGKRMIHAAVDAVRESSEAHSVSLPHLIAVTLLTSLTAGELCEELAVPLPVSGYVTHLARLAQASGAVGVVTSPQEIAAVRAACGADFLIVTPGVRPAGVATGDQRRVMTPGEAIREGADYLVLGRAITADPHPADAARRILDEMAAA